MILVTCLCLILQKHLHSQKQGLSFKLRKEKKSISLEALDTELSTLRLWAIISLPVSLNLEPNWLGADGVMTSSSPSMFLSSSFLPTIVSYLLFSLFTTIFSSFRFYSHPSSLISEDRNWPYQLAFSTRFRLLSKLPIASWEETWSRSLFND